MRLLIIALLLFGVSSSPPPVPAFEMWVECIERGPYAGRAVADVSYRYSGEFPITAEDSRFFGDTTTGQTQVFDFRIQPGEHRRDTRLNVGAQKVVTWKVVLFGELHVVTAWDNPEVPDCGWETEPSATPAPPQA